MSTCLTGHAECRVKGQPKSYPTRLLEIDKSGLRLIDPETTPISGPYAALSYCWGSNPSFLRLTAWNQNRLRAGIADDELPIAFCEALKAVRCLNILYIWIDSLCIIQSGPGSTEDWAHESSRMADVYSNSILCLALYRAANPHESTFRGGVPPFMPPIEVDTRCIFDRDESIHHSCVVFSSSYYEDALYRQPLGSRGWALQERLLSPRVLGFGCGELFWSCAECQHACESFPDGLRLEDNFFQGLQLTSVPSTIEAKDNWTLTTVWFRVVEEYTNRDLTFPESDKLVALSAVALRLGQAMDDVCIWGHFNKSLIRSLYWGRATRRSQVASDGRWTNGVKFPSWSWASMDGPISFEHEVFGTMVTSPLASFERYVIQSPGTGHQQISTILLQLQVYEMKGQLQLHRDESGGTVYTFAPTAYSRIIDCARKFTAFLDDYQNPTEGAHVTFCPLMADSGRDPATLKSCDFVLGIFVEKTGHLLDGRFIFHRVGCGYIELKDWEQWQNIYYSVEFRETSKVLLS
ncbi:uncharacterized protein CCOS01_11974 [Colletotrichum costaricense]|uniref:Heterokaryon incompatibility domain-containing protein n=1 Tax=Colletotrichum costaricense TaxID=1209916 RepID=A0AAJ0DW86_9PEZI|nr:uncharacterized protein CCOS01_11974 [Colletotrichum costaricense]KAK1517717.1 hypothetical protein CCOS01_11974 [Colletotrichum costaricense]